MSDGDFSEAVARISGETRIAARSMPDLMQAIEDLARCKMDLEDARRPEEETSAERIMFLASSFRNAEERVRELIEKTTSKMIEGFREER